MTHKNNNDLYVQYGAGNEAIAGWLNFDASPRLRLQKLPIIGRLFRRSIVFDEGIIYGDIVKGLPVAPETVRGLFAAHVLEHLSYEDAVICIQNSFSILQPGGRFRLIVPDLSYYIKEYVNSKSKHIKTNKSASSEYNFHSGLGTKQSLKSVFSRMIRAFGNSEHLWMWDEESLIFELAEAGFVDISKFEPSNSDDPMFIAPERDHQFYGERGHYGLCLQAFKPR